MKYDIHTEIEHGPLERIDLAAIAARGTEKWWNRSLVRVNDCVARIGVFEGEFHWHRHEREDELFYVIEGCLLLDLEDRTVELEPKQAILVPRGVLHRTRAPARTVVLMVEAATVVPTGDGEREK